MTLSPRFADALQYATTIHAGQMRKGTNIPYISHLLAVAAIAFEFGATEDEAIGALLHDAGEDAGGQDRIEDIRRRFGPAVAEIVDGCTDTVMDPKPPWRPRKEAYIAHVPSASASVQLVSACDKLHNARSVLRDYRNLGEGLWNRFNGGCDGTLWYYTALLAAFRQSGRGNIELLDELDRTISEIKCLAKVGV